MSVTAGTCGVFYTHTPPVILLLIIHVFSRKIRKMPIPSQDFEPGLDLGLDNFSLSRHFHFLQVT